ncbi:BTB/POZ domain-containing protein 6-B-like [Paramacrobiotus metropolitanus]|uniref:BTB/POZ domain-containing protein 6-B-like n=1 Tax=Paramacrobiotus metropolitanus TaxID=2943436 RepID=UPI0024464C32|nr:BTB/POZ domain-containing protein 6-B-like [Paramacrobiotus metropolitanus]
MSAAAFPPADFRSSKHLRKRARFLLEHPDLEIPTDIEFEIGVSPGKVFKTHKLFLALVSAVFQTLFYGSIELKEERVEIPDITPEAFQNLLHYAFTDDISGITMHNVMDTLYCAKKYMIDKLSRACRDYVQSHLTADCACDIFQQAQAIGESELATLALA